MKHLFHRNINVAATLIPCELLSKEISFLHTPSTCVRFKRVIRRLAKPLFVVTKNTTQPNFWGSLSLKISSLDVFWWSAADVKMDIPVLVRSLKSSILSSTSFQMGKTFWGVASAAVEQSMRKANIIAQGNSAVEADPRIPPNPKKTCFKKCSATRLTLSQFQSLKIFMYSLFVVRLLNWDKIRHDEEAPAFLAKKDQKLKADVVLYNEKKIRK